jgi:imidazolonepropionase
MRNLPLRGALKDEQLEIITQAGIFFDKEGVITSIGKFADMKPIAVSQNIEIQEFTEELVAFPGLIDCHTHTCYAGARAQDFAMRMAGKSYLDIARAGGGILHTVRATRQISHEDLKNLTRTRVLRHLQEGVTTCEIKTGYGLTVESEMKMLRIIKELQDENLGIDLVPTCLAAHIRPPEYMEETDYLDHILRNLLPEIKKQDLCKRVDIFVEETAFGVDDAQYFLQKVRALGFDITIHADQFTPVASRLAVDMKAKSADHLESTTDAEIAFLAPSETVAVALPGASLGTGDKFAPVRKLLDAGAMVAIATDYNPGSAPMGNLILQASILAMYEKLSSAEVWAGITFRAAHALALYDRGVLEVGKRADIVAYQTDDYRNILYQPLALGKLFATWSKGVRSTK